ncbi:aromatic amino acid transport family protein [Shewanella fidelis]|uniref:Aromatic amino acid permease n=1 Tax=Shewanella fidelis TaxID=173509 RepID=A0AAW8NS93_9GAMM|nr:aromatic amino acid transport family protein [Shewanella fidelis]MDR8525285.1 aromatic amino acid transporter [Shewanella fidelis]MDW4813678.1 aromatic amino acid transporter [Shewanella fidelis]MDW4817664.1 aromatic amino acid transporter [Shewanella fidelis]MDW4821731.1 aromatic amino acid transporter [Shewanella fidelis]MDW4826006.1 aromatic amino acid transporter [Shewanella fidelis]
MNKSKIFGSMLIIAGTTIGAGMLALPLAASGLGFGMASLVMLLIWSLMTYTALLMIEVHQHAPVDATLHTLANKLLGRKGQVVASFSMMFLFYALCSAYIAGGGEQIHSKLTNWFDWQLPIQAGAIIFTLLIGTVVAIGTRSVDMINRSLFTLKLIALVVMLFLLLPHVSVENLVALPVHQGLVLASLPVIFTSFGFHGSIPSIVRYLGKDTKALRWIIVVGSSLPLMVYVLWMLASQGVLAQPDLMASQSLNGFIGSLSRLLHNPMIASAVSVFADLALATSFLGVSLGLYDFIADLLKRSSTPSHRVQVGLVTFLPPLGFALFYPQGFITALGYAAFALVILAIFLPVAMVYAQRKQQIEGYQVKGGILGLAAATLAGVLIISVQLLQMFNLLPTVG